MTIINITTSNGKNVSYDSERPAGNGARKLVYFSPDSSYVVAFYKKTLEPEDRQRIETIINQYTPEIFLAEGGEYWREILCWMQDSFEYRGKNGIVLPRYPRRFIFEFGSINNDSQNRIRGKEKGAKWFTSPYNRFKSLDSRERGDNWLKYIQSCLCIARGVQRLHASGLAHGDLSYNNVLIDPLSGRAYIIDIDELIVPNRFPPRVIGSPDFTAPEVIRTRDLPTSDVNRKRPNIFTDLHALAVLIYHLLLCRHPLDGSKCHDPNDSDHDYELLMGERALFVEHPTDVSNRPYVRQADPIHWEDVERIPYTITGPYLKALFDKAFIDGLHAPHKRPTAYEWTLGLVRTLDILLPCQNQSCPQKWFVFNHTSVAKCPFCGSNFNTTIPVLEFYSRQRESNEFKSENIHFVVHQKKSIYLWHTDKNIFPNEKLTLEQKKPMGYFSYNQGKWFFENQNLDGMTTIDPSGKTIPVAHNAMLEIKDNQWICFSSEPNGRRVLVRIKNKR